MIAVAKHILLCVSRFAVFSLSADIVKWRHFESHQVHLPANTVRVKTPKSNNKCLAEKTVCQYAVNELRALPKCCRKNDSCCLYAES